MLNSVEYKRKIKSIVKEVNKTIKAKKIKNRYQRQQKQAKFGSQGYGPIGKKQRIKKRESIGTFKIEEIFYK